MAARSGLPICPPSSRRSCLACTPRSPSSTASGPTSTHRTPPRSTTWWPPLAADWHGTFAGALEAREIEVDPHRYEVEAVGEIETEDRVLVIKRIHVLYRLAIPEERREEAERVHSFHARCCPVARSLEGAIEISTELELV